MNLCLSGRFQKNLLMPYRLNLLNKIWAVMSMPLYFPVMFRVLFMLSNDENIIKQRQACKPLGQVPEYDIRFSVPKNVSTLKAVSKNHLCTINDLVTLALSQTLRDYFAINTPEGQQVPKFFHICVPANVRMSHYQTEEEVRLENQFTVVPMWLPLLNKADDFSQNMKRVMKQTDLLKSSLTYGLCYYYMTVLIAKFYPFDLGRYFCIMSSKPYTCAFSNVVGPLRHRSKSYSNDED